MGSIRSPLFDVDDWKTVDGHAIDQSTRVPDDIFQEFLHAGERARRRGQHRSLRDERGLEVLSLERSEDLPFLRVMVMTSNYGAETDTEESPQPICREPRRLMSWLRRLGCSRRAPLVLELEFMTAATSASSEGAVSRGGSCADDGKSVLRQRIRICTV